MELSLKNQSVWSTETLEGTIQALDLNSRIPYPFEKEHL